MSNSLIERFKLEKSENRESKYKRVPGSSVILGKNDEKYLKSMTVYECNGKKGYYKALKVVFEVDNELVELTPWPTLDYSSSERCEHLQEVEPKFVTFFEQVDTETGEKFNKVHITDMDNKNEVERSIKLWNERQ